MCILRHLGSIVEVMSEVEQGNVVFTRVNRGRELSPISQHEDTAQLQGFEGRVFLRNTNNYLVVTSDNQPVAGTRLL